ncbi:hypothetical protein SQ11_07400 [Nitrosospira sp. NpAV]|nr:hypothetical protein SQ11_07400 [Nitrosospira sp. NpAV]
MAAYKKSISLTLPSDPVFNKIYSPSDEVVQPGIYRCTDRSTLPGAMRAGKPAHDRMVAGK